MCVTLLLRQQILPRKSIRDEISAAVHSTKSVTFVQKWNVLVARAVAKSKIEDITDLGYFSLYLMFATPLAVAEASGHLELCPTDGRTTALFN